MSWSASIRRVAWDIAFVALAPGRTSLSVLAATDTD
ncbi:DUF6183 family protein [Nocardia sp. NPDC050408]